MMTPSATRTQRGQHRQPAASPPGRRQQRGRQAASSRHDGHKRLATTATAWEFQPSAGRIGPATSPKRHRRRPSKPAVDPSREWHSDHPQQAPASAIRKHWSDSTKPSGEGSWFDPGGEWLGNHWHGSRGAEGVRSDLDEANSKPCERADRNGVRIDASAEPDRTDQRCAIERRAEALIRLHSPQKVDEE